MTNYDFHFHSNYSDGYWDIDGILEYAKNIGMKGLILTDHDEIGGQKEFTSKARAQDIRTSTGIEITAKYGQIDLHILGYGIDLKSPALMKMLENNKRARMTRNAKVLAKLEKLGFVISEEDIKIGKSKEYLGRLKIANTILKNPVNHRLLKNPTTQGVFEEYLGEGGKAYFVVEKVNPKGAIEIIHHSGGIASLAHPGQYYKEFEAFNKTAKELLAWNIDGLEVYSQKHNEEQSAYYRTYAKKNNLIMTFGSDDHGWPNNRRTMGEIFAKDDEELAEALFTKLEKLKQLQL
jgi:predicted metal-dependent phosphoesterase TrpH